MNDSPLISTRTTRTSLILSTLACLAVAVPSRAIDPRPAPDSAEWAGEVWGEVQVIPAITKSTNSVTVRATVRGGPAGNPSWHCSQYSGWVAAGTSSIAIIVPEDWSFTSGEGFVRSIGGRAVVLESSAGDPPPYGWEDRLSDTCYCTVETFGASGDCETREVVPTFATAYQQEIMPGGPIGQWVPISAGFSGWNGVSYYDEAASYVMVIDETEDLEDNDHDGLADVWEVANFGDLTTADATSSYDDGDGIDDLTEFNRWMNGELDGDGSQYDPTANNTAAGGGGGGGGGGAGGGASSGPQACGAAGMISLAMSFLGLTLMTTARRAASRPRRARRASFPRH